LIVNKAHFLDRYDMIDDEILCLDDAMKRLLLIIILILAALLVGCGADPAPDIAATTLPVYEFTTRLCDGTDLTVGRLVTESVSCLHDYSLQVSQMQMIEGADTVVVSGAGLEEFLEEALDSSKACIDASAGAHIHEAEEGHDHEHDAHGHIHEQDPHIWLSPENAKTMAQNICNGLCRQYPAYRDIFQENLDGLIADLDNLQRYGEENLAQLSCREIITFHDGFAYFAESFDLTILRAVEEESGSEASASELKELIDIVKEHNLPAIFTEINGSASAADVIAAETNANIFALDMAMSGDGYFDAMYHNIDTIKEALE